MNSFRFLAGHGGAVGSAAFSPDGKFVAIGSSDGIVQLSETKLEDLEQSVCSRVLRDVSDAERVQYELNDQEASCSSQIAQESP